MKLVYCLRVSLIGLTLLSSSLNYAQRSRSAVYQQAADSTGILVKTETTPTNDSVLDIAPSQLNLQFSQRVRLVKLTLRDQRRDWVDISFRYDPASNDKFSWVLPSLEDATYYTVDWAVLSANEHLVRGSFSFSFGPGAEPPSVSKEAEALLLELRNLGSGQRFVTPPRTEIIINRDPPHFDPPFTIELEQSDNPDPP